MKKFLIALTVVVAAVAIALPASAAELKFGGMYFFKFYSVDNVLDGEDKDPDNANYFWNRVRLYFDAVGSEYVKVVTKFEMDNIFGREGHLAQDTKTVEVKNVYLNFAIPDTPVSFDVGAAGVKIDRAGLVLNDDTSIILGTAKFDPVLVKLGWSRLGDNRTTASDNWTPFNNGDNVDYWVGTVQYIQEQFIVGLNFGWINTKSGLFGSYDSAIGSSSVQTTPVTEITAPISANGVPLVGDDTIVEELGDESTFTNDDLNLIILSLDFTWNADFWNVYFTGLMNAGKDEGFRQTDTGLTTGTEIEDEIKYSGYLLAAGGRAQFDQWGVGLDFYLASGDDDSTDDKYEQPIVINPGSSLGTYNMDAVVMPGWFDDENSVTTTTGGGSNSPRKANNTSPIKQLGSGNSPPANVWGIGARGTFAPLEKSLVEFGVAYFQFVEDVLEKSGTTKDTKDLGFSTFARYSQAIVDGLTFKTELGYLFAGDGYCTRNKSCDNAYKIGAGLFWSW
jgi:hypothetical protein